MSYAPASRAIHQYGRIRAHGGVESASPHRLVAMLLDDVLSRIASARGHMQRGEVAAKGEAISRAIDVLGGLRVSLDHERGGELAERLEDLYEYLGRLLFEANARNDVDTLDKAAALLRPIKEAWDAIPAELHNPPHPAEAAARP